MVPFIWAWHRLYLTVSSHPLVSALLKGVFHELAVPSHLMLTWNLPLVQNHLAKPPIEPLGHASLHIQGIKVAFLLQFASGRRVNWTVRIRITDRYLRHQNEYMIFPELTTFLLWTFWWSGCDSHGSVWIYQLGHFCSYTSAMPWWYSA